MPKADINISEMIIFCIGVLYYKMGFVVDVEGENSEDNGDYALMCGV